MKAIFISHSHHDARLAERFQRLLEHSSGRALAVHRSSEPGAIKSGASWRGWIDDKILNCDVAIVLLTPSSFRGRWVLWEAGAVAGVQYERFKNGNLSNDDPLSRRVRIVKFNLTREDFGPFANTQIVHGTNLEDMVAFMSDLLTDLLGTNAVKGLLKLEADIKEFIPSACEDLRYTPIEASEGIVQDWLGRIDERSAKDDRWIVAAKRWINVAFLGAGRANAHLEGEPIDFRIHIRIAAAHRRLRDWKGVIEQLQLAAMLSPNDMVVLRELGGAYREIGDTPSLERTMSTMEQLDPDVFKRDREGIALRCGHFVKLGAWAKADELLTQADAVVVSSDPYLANWHAVAAMQVRGAPASEGLFRELKELVRRLGKDFWNEATLVNAHLALGELEDAKRVLERLNFRERSSDQIESATRFYDEILRAFNRTFDWRHFVPVG